MSPTNKFLITLSSILILSGCATVKHLDQLLTLQNLSKNGDLKEACIQEHNDKLKALIDAIHTDAIKDYDSTKVLAEFGEPTFVKKQPAGGEWVERWVYRDAGKLTSAEKVYLYFDSTLKLVRSEHIPVLQPPKAEETPEAPQQEPQPTVTQ